MGRLTFWKKWDTDGDEGIIVCGDEAVKERTAEALNGRSGACEPGFGDAEDSTFAAVVWK